MATYRDGQLAVIFSPEAARQSDYATATATAALDTSLTLTERAFYTIDKNRREQYDCTDQELFARILLSRMGTLPLSLLATRKNISAFLAYAMGVAAAPTGTGAAPRVHHLTELGVFAYQPPPFSLIVAVRGSSTVAVKKLTGCVLNSLEISASTDEAMTCRAEVKFNPDVVDVASYTVPDCDDELALSLADVEATVNSNDITDILRRFTLRYSHNLLTQGHPFTAGSTEPKRIERANRRARELSLGVLGEQYDDMFALGESEANAPFTLQLGKEADDNILIDCPNAIFDLGSPGVSYDGEARESNVNLTALPTKVPGNGDSPLNADVTNAQTVAYLVAA